MDIKKTNQIIGNNIKYYRTLSGISQKKLGSYLNISFQQIQKYENGKDRISASFLHQISLHLEIPITLFFNGLKVLQEQQNDDKEVIKEHDSDRFYKHLDSNSDLSMKQHNLIDDIRKLSDKKIVSKITKLIKTINQINQDTREETSS